MNRLLFSAAALAGIVLSLAACNSSSNPAPIPTLGPTCQLPSGVQTSLVYPAPGSAVPAASVTRLVIGSTTALDPSRFQLVITDALFPPPLYIAPGNALVSATPPFPTPNATPSFANPQYQSSTLTSVFASSQVVTVYVNDTKSGDNCRPLSLGQFTAQ